MRRADNLTTFMCWLSWNLGASVSWNPQGLYRPVQGLLYLKQTDRLWCRLRPLSKGYRKFLPWGEAAKARSDHSPTHSAEDKNEWIYASTPNTCLACGAWCKKATTWGLHLVVDGDSSFYWNVDNLILVNNQLDAQFFYFRIYLFQSSACFEHPCAHRQENLFY